MRTVNKRPHGKSWVCDSPTQVGQVPRSSGNARENKKHVQLEKRCQTHGGCLQSSIRLQVVQFVEPSSNEVLFFSTEYLPFIRSVLIILFFYVRYTRCGYFGFYFITFVLLVDYLLIKLLNFLNPADKIEKALDVHKFKDYEISHSNDKK